MNDKTFEIQQLVELIVDDLISGRKIVDEVWINPQADPYVGKRKFREVREAVKPYGISLYWIDAPLVDSHPWYFIRTGEEDKAPKCYMLHAKKID